MLVEISRLCQQVVGRQLPACHGDSVPLPASGTGTPDPVVLRIQAALKWSQYWRGDGLAEFSLLFKDVI